MRGGDADQWLDQQRMLVASELRSDEVVAAGMGGARRPNKVGREQQQCPSPQPRDSLVINWDQHAGDAPQQSLLLG
jgi:hypothetical protein